MFQALPVANQNDCDELLIDDQRFVDHHRRYLPARVVLVATERFFDNTHGCLRYSQPILEAGVTLAGSQVDFCDEGFTRRGGHYDWSNPPVQLRAT